MEDIIDAYNCGKIYINTFLAALNCVKILNMI